MIKLTDEQIDRAIEAFAGGAEWSDADYKNAVNFARAIEAEVLRIYGLDHSADAGEMMLSGISAIEYARQCREVPERAAAMDSARERLGFAPRATGCPDTMDDMGRFAVDQKAAGEEKSPPATGPAG